MAADQGRPVSLGWAEGARRNLQLVLPVSEHSVRLARRVARTVLAAWQLPDTQETAVLLLSELVVNAIQHARDKAAERGIAAHFEVADALNLWQFGLAFDTVIDSGVFHIFDDEDRARYVASLASVLEPGGSLYLICFSEHQPGTSGPRRVRQDELRAAFSDGWNVTEIVPEKFEVKPESGFGTAAVEAWLATIRRLLRGRRRGGPRPVGRAG